MSRSRLIGTLTVVLCLPVVTVAWLGFRLIQQDRALESQRVAETRELAVSQAVQTLSGLLSDPRLLSLTPRDGAILAAVPRTLLLYTERVAAQLESPPELFREGETLEFGRRDPAAASEIYRKQTQSRDPLLR